MVPKSKQELSIRFPINLGWILDTCYCFRDTFTRVDLVHYPAIWRGTGRCKTAYLLHLWLWQGSYSYHKIFIVWSSEGFDRWCTKASKSKWRPHIDIYYLALGHVIVTSSSDINTTTRKQWSMKKLFGKSNLYNWSESAPYFWHLMSGTLNSSSSLAFFLSLYRLQHTVV